MTDVFFSAKFAADGELKISQFVISVFIALRMCCRCFRQLVSLLPIQRPS